MALVTRDMTKYMYQALYRHKVRVRPYIDECEQHLNKLQKQIVHFLVELNPKLDNATDQATSNSIIHIVEYLERIGDHNSSIVMHYDILSEDKTPLPDNVMAQFKQLHHQLQSYFYNVISALSHLTLNESDFNSHEVLNDAIVEIENQLQLDLAELLRAKKLVVNTSVQLMEILHHFERIRSLFYLRFLSNYIRILNIFYYFNVYSLT